MCVHITAAAAICMYNIYCYRPKPQSAASGDSSDTTTGTTGDDTADDSNAVFDPRDMIEPVDLIAQLAKTEFKAKLALDKWSEKVRLRSP
jgi:hypothetical protein